MAEKEKVYLTRKQKEAYDELESESEGFAESIIRIYFEKFYLASKTKYLFHEISVDDLVAIAYNLKDIAIKNKFEIGDFIAIKWAHRKEEMFYYIRERVGDQYTINPHKKGHWEASDHMNDYTEARLATEEEKVWISDLGRDFVGQLLNGDVVVYADLSTDKLHGPNTVGILNELVKRIIGIHPAESYSNIVNFGKRGLSD